MYVVWVRVCVYECVTFCESTKEKIARKSVCVCVCVCVQETERGREPLRVCPHFCVCMFVCVRVSVCVRGREKERREKRLSASCYLLCLSAPFDSVI